MPNQQVEQQSTSVRYSDRIEVKQPDEAEDTQRAITSFREMAQFAFEKHRHANRTAHAESHGIVKGELRVYDALPDELRQGMFRRLNAGFLDD